MEYEDELIDGHDSLPVTGRYHFGRHFLTLDPVDTDRLGIYCQFDGYDLDRCEGHIAHEASGNVCAEFIFVRKHGKPTQPGSFVMAVARSKNFRL